MSDPAINAPRTAAARTAAAKARFDAYKGPNTRVEGIGREVIRIILDERAAEALEADESSWNPAAGSHCSR